MINIDKIRKDFPILNRTVNGKPLVYFDNAATSQTPQIVIDTIVDYYSNFNVFANFAASNLKNFHCFFCKRSIFQTFWRLHCCAKFLFIELDSSNFGYLLIFEFC